MICNNCGAENDNKSMFCMNCGCKLNVFQEKQKDGSFSVASMVLGIVGIALILFLIGIIPSIVGLILGIISIAKDNPKKGMAITGISLSFVSIIIFFFIILGMNISDKEIDTVEENNVYEEKTEKEVEEDLKTETEMLDPLEEKGYIESGESFTIDNLKITLNESSTDFQDYENEYGWNTPSEGMKYVMASFTYENIGDSGDEYVSIYDFDCFADNANCEQTYSIDESNFINTNLSPGRNVSFKVYFEIPQNTQSIELEYKESVWNDNRVKIKIQ